MLTSCFTGIESTPKITAHDVKKQHASATPEMKYTDDVNGEPVTSWSPGKQFVVTEGKISFALSPIDIADRLEPGDTLTFAGMTGARSLTDIDDSMLLFTTEGGDTLRYRVQEPVEKVLKRTDLEIPFTIEMTLVDRAAELLNGNDYYIKTPVWFNDRGDNISGRKFVKVHVDSVTAGNSNYPLAVYFTDESGFSSKVYMSIGTGRRATRNFDTLFLLSDPRRRYKDISDEVWACITRGTVRTDMTREECRLSLGNPNDIVRGHYLERWTYDNGMILIFDDGHLREVRRVR